VTEAKDDRVARLWDGKSGTLLAALEGHQGPISSVSWSQDGARLVTRADSDRVARLWDGKSGTLLAALEGHQGPISSVSWSQDGARLVTRADSDRVARLWDGKSGTLLAALEGHQGPISSVSWSQDGARLVTWAKDDRVARLWDATTGLALQGLFAPGNSKVIAARISVDMKVVTVVGDREITVWKMPKANVLQGDNLIETACSRLLPAGATPRASPSGEPHPCTRVGPLALRFWIDWAHDVGARVYIGHGQHARSND
jgi:WD40 repeat protein